MINKAYAGPGDLYISIFRLLHSLKLLGYINTSFSITTTLYNSAYKRTSKYITSYYF